MYVEEILTARRTQSQERLKEFVSKLNRAEEIAGDKACVYATGSFGRSEASWHSDLDLFIVGRGTEEQRELKNLKEICLKAELIDATRQLGIPEFSGDGEYLIHYTIDEIVKTTGKPEDDLNNTFTARLLLLLESRAFALRQSSGTSCDSTAHCANCVLPRCGASACMMRQCGIAPTKSIKAFWSRHTESVQNFRANGRASRE